LKEINKKKEIYHTIFLFLTIKKQNSKMIMIKYLFFLLLNTLFVYGISRQRQGQQSHQRIKGQEP